MVGWHHRLSGHDFGQTPAGSEGVLQCMGSQRVGHDLATEQEQELTLSKVCASSLQEEAFSGRLSGLTDTHTQRNMGGLLLPCKDS